MRQDVIIENLVAFFQRDEDVRAVGVYGSCSPFTPAKKDEWSDVDLLVVAGKQAVSRYFPAIDWLQTFGEVYGFEQNSNQFTYTTRICFSDLRRLDIVFTTEWAPEQIVLRDSIGFWNGTRVIFSRSTAVDTILARKFERPKPSPISAEQFQGRVNRFWFKASLTVTRVVRDDLLIALHLALDLTRDCCVLGMLLRDRAAETNHHCQGGMGNDFVGQLQAVKFSYDALGILEIVEKSSVLFDSLATQWSNDYKDRHQPLITTISRARQSVRQSWI